jgi:hypothetical protein
LTICDLFNPEDEFEGQEYINIINHTFGSEAWVLKKREEQRLEAAQMKFLRHLLGITRLGKEKNQCIRQKAGAQNTVKEIKQY